jgi:hypothetical protein
MTFALVSMIFDRASIASRQGDTTVRQTPLAAAAEGAVIGTTRMPLTVGDPSKSDNGLPQSFWTACRGNQWQILRDEW